MAGQYDDKTVGVDAQANYAFITRLFAADHQTLRASLTGAATEDAARQVLLANGINVGKDTALLIVDVQNCTTKQWRKSANTYVLILPPVPTRSKAPEYINLQAWASAWYHATNDGYGM